MRGQQHALALGLRGARPALGARARSWPLDGLGAQARRASAWTSRISATVPSPRIVAPGVEADRLQLAAERLDDDLLGVDDPVDDEAEAASLGLQHGDDHVAVVPVGRRARGRR